MTMQPGIPQKVLVTARTLGVHNDCLIAAKDDESKLCADCHHNLMIAFDFHYAHIEDSSDVLLAIVDDVLEDLHGE